ncbi:MAG: ornithine--oxo-acid transaminase, partial [Zoogloea sp.]|nr:ornithine--oxo-acid transaminase [Zoogloea sp.]
DALPILWTDAHLDSHTTHTTQSGNIHGMPLAALLGQGDRALTGLDGPHLDPSRVCVVGAHSWEDEEAVLLDRLGVRVFRMDEVARRGLPVVMAEALAIARRGSAGFGLSLDLDALDPAALPAVTCPVPHGMAPEALVEVLALLRGCPDLVALEIVEYVPALDADGRTGRWLARFASAALGVGAVA